MKVRNNFFCTAEVQWPWNGSGCVVDNTIGMHFARSDESRRMWKVGEGGRRQKEVEVREETAREINGAIRPWNRMFQSLTAVADAMHFGDERCVRGTGHIDDEREWNLLWKYIAFFNSHVNNTLFRLLFQLQGHLSLLISRFWWTKNFQIWSNSCQYLLFSSTA